MTVDFNDYFWGEKNNGFDVLYHNMKSGLVASKDLSEFLREKSTVEEANSKFMTKLSHKAGTGCSNGTFAPVWTMLKGSTERLSTLHAEMAKKIADLVKDIAKYADDLHRKHKTVKDEEAGTLDAVQAMQTSTVAVQKAKDVYTARIQELEKLKKDNSSPKDLEKMESKVKKQQDDYKNLVEKHLPIKLEFERKMTITCKRFQEIEESHLRQMREFLVSYMELMQSSHDMVGQVHQEFKRQFLDMTVDKLLEQFVLNKYTGLEKPVSGFLRSRREKAKSKKAAVKKKKDSNNQDNVSAKEDPKSDIEEKEENSKVDSLVNLSSMSKSPSVGGGVMAVVPMATPEIDEDGYSIQPKSGNGARSNSFYSSSDSDSDDDTEHRDKKIHVEIKPLNNGTAPISASVDELRATVETISLSTLGGGTISANNHQSMAIQSPTASNVSTPTTAHHPYAALQSPTFSMSNNSASRYADLGDIFSEVAEITSAGAAAADGKLNRQIPTPTSATSNSSIAIPRPPSRRSEMALRGRCSPMSIGRADSVGSLEFRTASVVGLGSSRGPSPLTIGMSDAIPIAVAFHEIIHAYFRGSDENRCQVKINGDMMLSFPAGIVNVLANNPNPPKLGFRIKTGDTNLDQMLPNSQLVQLDKGGQSNTEDAVLELNMVQLTALLRRQSEQNPTAAYFNVDILKYQVKVRSGAASCPFQLVSYWKCEPKHTDLKIDYKYNSHAMNVASPLLNVSISVPVDGGVRNVQSKPHSAWLGESNRLVWNFTDISQYSDNNGVGTLRARLEVTNGPSSPAMLSAQFNCEGTTLSGIDFQLTGSGYRMSLVKRRFVCGKYICEADGIRNQAQTPTPPMINK